METKNIIETLMAEQHITLEQAHKVVGIWATEFRSAKNQIARYSEGKTFKELCEYCEGYNYEEYSNPIHKHFDFYFGNTCMTAVANENGIVDILDSTLECTVPRWISEHVDTERVYADLNGNELAKIALDYYLDKSAAKWVKDNIVKVNESED